MPRIIEVNGHESLIDTSRVEVPILTQKEILVNLLAENPDLVADLALYIEKRSDYICETCDEFNVVSHSDYVTMFREWANK